MKNTINHIPNLILLIFLYSCVSINEDDLCREKMYANSYRIISDNKSELHKIAVNKDLKKINIGFHPYTFVPEKSLLISSIRRVEYNMDELTNKESLFIYDSLDNLFDKLSINTNNINYKKIHLPIEYNKDANYIVFFSEIEISDFFYMIAFVFPEYPFSETDWVYYTGYFSSFTFKYDNDCNLIKYKIFKGFWHSP